MKIEITILKFIQKYKEQITAKIILKNKVGELTLPDMKDGQIKQ